MRLLSFVPVFALASQLIFGTSVNANEVTLTKCHQGQGYSYYALEAEFPNLGTGWTEDGSSQSKYYISLVRRDNSIDLRISDPSGTWLVSERGGQVQHWRGDLEGSYVVLVFYPDGPVVETYHFLTQRGTGQLMWNSMKANLGLASPKSSMFTGLCISKW